METVEITRRSKVGYNVNTQPSQGEHGYYFEDPTSPHWIGTLKTVAEQLQHDAYLNSLTNTFKSSAWFVRVNNVWRKIADGEINDTDMLYWQDDYGQYTHNEVEVHIHDLTPRQQAASLMGKSRSERKSTTSRENGKLGGKHKPS
jgi:hypothetical protein